MPDDVRKMLDELERLEKAATKAPWRCLEDGIVQTEHVTRDVWHIPRSTDDLELIAAARNALPTLLRLARRAGEMEKAAREVLSAAHLRTHGFPEGDISDLDFSKMLPAIVKLDAALANLKEQGHD